MDLLSLHHPAPSQLGPLPLRLTATEDRIFDNSNGRKRDELGPDRVQVSSVLVPI